MAKGYGSSGYAPHKASGVRTPSIPQQVTQGVEKPVRGARTKTDREPMSTPHYKHHIARYGKDKS